MKRIHPILATAATLAAVSATAVLPTLTPATPASAAATCGGTSLAAVTNTNGQARIPTVGNATPGKWGCDLGPNDSGPAVTRLQIDLNDCYGNHLAVDGSYGAATQAAVEDVQDHESGVAQDGIYGPQTIGFGTGSGFKYQRSGVPVGPGSCGVLGG